MKGRKEVEMGRWMDIGRIAWKEGGKQRGIGWMKHFC